MTVENGNTVYAGANIGTGGPPSLGLNTSRTAWPI